MQKMCDANQSGNPFVIDLVGSALVVILRICIVTFPSDCSYQDFRAIGFMDSDEGNRYYAQRFLIYGLRSE